MSRSSNEKKKLKHLAGKRRWDQVDGRFVVNAWRDSGLPMETFAREHGFGGWRLRWWASRFEGMVLAEAERSSSAGHEQGLVPMVAVGTGTSSPGHIVGAAIILRLPDGIEVELRDVARVEPEEIGRLVGEVRRAR